MVSSRIGFFFKKSIKGEQIAKTANLAAQTGLNLALVYYFGDKENRVDAQNESKPTLKKTPKR